VSGVPAGGGWAGFTWRREPAAVVLAAVALALAAAIAVLSGSNQTLDLLFQVVLWATIATAWNIIGGFGGQLSLGHATFYGLGGYAAALLLLGAGLSPIAGAAVGVLLAVALGLVVGLAGLRLRGPFFAMVTFVTGPAFQTIATNWTGFTGGSGGVSLPLRGEWYMLIFANRRIYVFLALGLLAVTLFVTYRLRYTHTGMYLIAAGADPDAARSLGVNVLWVRLGGMALSAALTALCGVLATVYTLFLDPENAFGAPLSIKAVTVAIIGGAGSLVGPLLGAVVLIPLEQYLSHTFAGVVRGLSGILFGLLLVVVVVLAPGGIAEGLQRLWPRLRRGPSPAPLGS
jgi:branched-chain amino acid transport system permease protein